MCWALKYGRPFAVAVLLLCMAGMPTLAGAQNFPPIACATSVSEEVFLGQPTVFSSAESIYPDAPGTQQFYRVRVN